MIVDQTGNEIIVRFRGGKITQQDLLTCNDLVKTVNQQKELKYIIFDMSGLTGINTSGTSLLFNIANSIRRNVDIEIINCPLEHRNLIENLQELSPVNIAHVTTKNDTIFMKVVRSRTERVNLGPMTCDDAQPMQRSLIEDYLKRYKKKKHA